MHILKNNFSIVTPFLLGVACVTLFSTIGSKVLSDGSMSEPFFLIPLAYLFFLFGIAITFVKAIRYISYKKEENEMEGY